MKRFDGIQSRCLDGGQQAERDAHQGAEDQPEYRPAGGDRDLERGDHRYDISQAEAQQHADDAAEIGVALAHPVQVELDSRLAGILGAGEVEVNSLHHQAVRQVAVEFFQVC